MTNNKNKNKLKKTKHKTTNHPKSKLSLNLRKGLATEQEYQSILILSVLHIW